MSHSMGHHKSNLKVIPTFTESSGPVLKFKWSTSAAHLALLEDNTTVIFPSIEIDRSQRKHFPASLLAGKFNLRKIKHNKFMRNQDSVSHSSISTHKSSPLPRIAKQCQSSTSIEQDKSSPRSSPLLLKYAQLHQMPPSSPIKRHKQSPLPISPIVEDKKNSISLVNRKLSTASRQSNSSQPSISSTTTITLLSTKPHFRIPNDNLVRLNTPQLRRLNVSEKYMNEAKKLYFDANCRSFIPRIAIA